MRIGERANYGKGLPSSSAVVERQTRMIGQPESGCLTCLAVRDLTRLRMLA